MAIIGWRRGMTTVLCTAALALAFPLPTANAADAPIHQLEMDALCGAQYPGNNIYRDGTAYVVAPGDAYSWRCQQTSLNGGAISNLGIDPGAFCSMPPPNRGEPVLVNPGSSDGWVCRTP